MACTWALSLLVAAPGFTDTNVSGIIGANTTWTAANSPYLVANNVVVNTGVTLTIEPGVLVKFNSGKALQIDGALIAQGTSASPIIFTSSALGAYWGYILFTTSSTDATYDAGGNYVSGSILSHCLVEYAGGLSMADNGAVRLSGAHPFITECAIRNNRATGIRAYNQSATLKITNCTITGNTSLLNGGGIFVNGGTATITGNTITNNRATREGGGIALTGGTATVSDNTITGNSADSSDGGGVYVFVSWSGESSHFQGNTIRGNTALGNGGGLYLYAGYGSSGSQVIDNTISGNFASREGGGLYVYYYNYYYSGAVVISNNWIQRNTSRWGGGAYLAGPSYTVSGNIIRENTTIEGSGGLYMTGGIVSDTFIVSNVVTGRQQYGGGDGGGGIGFFYADASLTNTIVADNRVPASRIETAWAGGGIGVFGGSTALSNNAILRNRAADGAGIWYQSGEAVSFSSNTITGNVALDPGPDPVSAVYIESRTPFTGNNLFGNRAESNPAFYELYNGNPQGSATLVAEYVWWGTAVSDEIAALIYDWFDDARLGFVDYEPYNTAIRSDTPISPPTELAYSRAGDSVTLSWAANLEPDAAGYRVYHGPAAGLPYANVVDVGTATTTTISGIGAAAHYFTVTAYDADYSPASDSPATIINENQTNGNESWYAAELALNVTVDITAVDPYAFEYPYTFNTGWFVVQRSGGLDSQLTVDYAISGSAQNGTDYNRLPGFVIIPAGEQAALISVNATNDGEVEGPETVVLTLIPQPGYEVFLPGSAEVIIADGPASGSSYLSVSPDENFDTSGFEGGPFSPASKTYTVRNNLRDGIPFSWYTDQEADWLTLSSVPQGNVLQIEGGYAPPGAAVDVPVTFYRSPDAVGAPSIIVADIFYDQNTLAPQTPLWVSDPQLAAWYSKSVYVDGSSPGRIILLISGGSGTEISTYDNQRAGGNPSQQTNPFPLGALKFTVAPAAPPGYQSFVGTYYSIAMASAAKAVLADAACVNGYVDAGDRRRPVSMMGDGAVEVSVNNRANELPGVPDGAVYGDNVIFSSYYYDYYYGHARAYRSINLTVYSIADDTWDPGDDDLGSATELNPPTAGEQTHGPHTLSNTDLADCFMVLLTEGQVYNFNTVGGSGDVMAYLLDSSGVEVAFDDNSAGNQQFRISYVPQYTGWYFLRIETRYPGDNASYTLRYSMTAVPVLSVSPQIRIVSAAAGSAMFSVSVAGGSTAWTASVLSGGGWLSILSGGSGTTSGTITASYATNPTAASRTGIIRVGAPGAWGAPVDLAVTQNPRGDSWDPLDDNVAGATLLNVPTEIEQTHGPHSLSNLDAADHFTVTLTAGVSYNFNSSGGSGDLAAVLLYDASHHEVARDNDSGGNGQFSLNYTPAVTGRYFLAVTMNVAGDSGYFLKYQINQAPPGVRTEVYVDANYGSDGSGDGSFGNPWRTIRYAMAQAGPNATAERPGTIHAAAGTYAEKVVFHPRVRIAGAGAAATIISFYDSGDPERTVVTAAEDTAIRDCTITLPAPQANVILLRIDNVRMEVANVILNGKQSPSSMGAFISGAGSSDSSMQNCTVRRVHYGVYTADTRVNITRNLFDSISGVAVFVSAPDKKDGPAATPLLGDATDTAGTGLNQFRNVSGDFVQNMNPAETKAEYNDWGVYTDAEITRKIAGTGVVDFDPFIGKGIGPGVVIAEVYGDGGRYVPDSANPSVTLGTLTAARDPHSQLFIFSAVPEGMHTVTAAASGYTLDSKLVRVSSMQTSLVTLRVSATFITDINGDAFTNAMDVQLVINAALGLNIGGLDADINGDGRVDAMDVQLVINGALGLIG